jgi:hypothetical protein
MKIPSQKKITRKSVVNNGVSNSILADRSKLSKELENLKNKMKEHFRFFDNHSPQLKKR